ncbi:MAG TPA: extracellular solute-binding protein [Patescibacteria group bacterium]|nr:extracellular solute-binding protein [Patescibacteria group bacterium]
MSKQKVKKIRVCFLIFSIAFASFGCGGPPAPVQQSVVLKWWKPFDTSDDVYHLIEAYRTLHPNVEIQYTKKNIENYETDLLEALAAGEGPDVFSINDSWLPKYLNKVTPAPATLMNYNDYNKTFVDVVVDDFTRDRKIYGVALSVDSLGLYYNKDLLHSAGLSLPPKTWSELSSMVPKLSRQDRNGYFMNSAVPLGTNSNINRAQDILYLFMLQRRTQPYSQDRTAPTFARSITVGNRSIEPGIEALQYYTSFANPRSSNYNWTTASDYSTDAFANGRATFVFGYTYLRDTINAKSPNLNYDVAPVPQPNLDDPAVNFANYWGEVVSKQSKHAQVAWDFLNFITQNKQAAAYAKNKRVGSSRRDIIGTQVADPEIGVFANASLTAKAFYRPDQAKIDRIILDAIDAVNFRGKTSEEALIEAEQKAATIKQEGF